MYFAFKALCLQVVDEKIFPSDSLLKISGKNSVKIVKKMKNKDNAEIKKAE